GKVFIACPKPAGTKIAIFQSSNFLLSIWHHYEYRGVPAGLGPLTLCCWAGPCPAPVPRLQRAAIRWCANAGSGRDEDGSTGSGGGSGESKDAIGADLTPPSPTPATGSPALVKSKTGLNARRVPSPVLGHRLVAPGSEKGNRSCSPEGGRLPGQTSAPPSPQLPSRTVGAACRLRVHSPRGQKEKAAQVTRTCSEGEDALHKLHGSASLIKDALESKQKLQKYAKSCFQASDANGDGQVSFEELCKCMQKMNADLGIGDFTERHVMHYLQRFDTDGDELLNEKEFQELYRALLLVKLEEVEPADFSRDMFIGRRKGKPEDNYEVFGIVGVGSFGVVRKVKCKLTGTTRVMKVVDKQKALNGGYPLKLIME
ncbi:Nict1, partial [Symbiodinium necroappetens]